MQKGVTCLHLTCARQAEHVFLTVEVLLKHRPDVNLRNNPEMDTALTLAARHLDPPDLEDVVLLLLKADADSACRNQVRNHAGISEEQRSSIKCPKWGKYIYGNKRAFVYWCPEVFVQSRPTLTKNPESQPGIQ